MDPKVGDVDDRDVDERGLISRESRKVDGSDYDRRVHWRSAIARGDLGSSHGGQEGGNEGGESQDGLHGDLWGAFWEGSMEVMKKKGKKGGKVAGF